MLIERIYDEDLAQASYLIGCQANGTAVVVDGRRDIAVYQELAEKNGMKIVAVTETHIHADYLSGTRELAAATGAKIYVSGEGGPDWQYEFDGERLYDGDKITIGNISIQALHTPGHTPEHLSFLVTDGAFSDQPGYLLSGDFVFSGDLGRPDLLDEAAGGDRHPLRRRQAALRQPAGQVPDPAGLRPGPPRARRRQRLRQGPRRHPLLHGRLRAALLLVGPLPRRERRAGLHRRTPRRPARRARLLRPDEARKP